MIPSPWRSLSCNEQSEQLSSNYIHCTKSISDGLKGTEAETWRNYFPYLYIEHAIPMFSSCLFFGFVLFLIKSKPRSLKRFFFLSFNLRCSFLLLINTSLGWDRRQALHSTYFLGAFRASPGSTENDAGFHVIRIWGGRATKCQYTQQCQKLLI